MARIAMLLIRIYQGAISPILPSTCRFEPSCSHYGYEAFSTHGFLRGFYLTSRRILRCNPFHPGGYDPVPDRDQGTEVELQP